jgi:hypothetical protein
VKKLLVIFGILGAGVWVFRDRILAGALALGGKVNQFVEDHTPDRDDDYDPRLHQFPEETEK